jgi:hypothetical protein
LEIHEFSNLADPVSYPIRDGNSIFIGLLPLGIIITVLVGAKDKLKRALAWRKNSAYLNTLLIFSFLAMLGYATWIAAVLYKLPLVYQIRQLGRYSILFQVALVAIFAVCLEIYELMELKKRQALTVAAAGIFLGVNGLYIYLLRSYIYSLHLAVHEALLGLGLVLLVVLRSKISRRAALTVLVILTSFTNTLWFFPRINSDTRVTSDYVMPDKLKTILEASSGQWRIQTNEGVLPINISNAYNFQAMNGYSATIYAPFFELVHKDLSHAEVASDLFGVRYMVGKTPEAGREITYSDPDSGVYVWVRDSALPKIFFTDKEGSFDRADYHGLKVRTLEYDDHLQKYSVDVPTDRKVIISELDYPGWVANVDGKSTPLLSYSLDNKPIFKALHLTAGTHTVQLQYKPFKIY